MEEYEGLSCHYSLVFLGFFFPRAACQLLPNVQFVGTAAFRLLYSVALSCFLATLSLSFLSITVCVFGDCPHISACIWKLKLPFEFFLLARWLNVGVVRWERSAFAKLAHIERRTYCAPHRSFTRTWAQTRTLTRTCTHGCNSRHAAGSPVCAHLSFWVPLNSRA